MAAALVASLALAPASAGTDDAPSASLVVDGAGTDIELSPHQYGLFYEDINYAADGGLYAELVRNRSFEFGPADHGSFTGLTGWEPVGRDGAQVRATVVSDEGRLNENNRHYLTLQADAAGAGIRNLGFNAGLAVRAGEEYQLSLRRAPPRRSS